MFRFLHLKDISLMDPLFTFAPTRNVVPITVKLEVHMII